MDMTWIAGLVTAACAGVGVIIAAFYKRNQNRKDQYDHEEKLVELGQKLADSNKILQDFTAMSRDFDYMRHGLDDVHADIKTLAAGVIKLNENTVSTDKMLLRNAILGIYFAYEKEQVIPEAQYESVLGLYDVYTSLGGNGFVHEKVEEMRTWRRI